MELYFKVRKPGYEPLAKATKKVLKEKGLSKKTPLLLSRIVPDEPVLELMANGKIVTIMTRDLVFIGTSHPGDKPPKKGKNQTKTSSSVVNFIIDKTFQQSYKYK